MPRKIKPVDYWKRLLKSGTLTAAEQIKAIEAIQRLERAEQRKERVQPKDARHDKSQSFGGGRVVHNPAAFALYARCVKAGFTGTAEQWVEYIKTAGTSLERINWKKVGSRTVFEPSDLLLK